MTMRLRDILKSEATCPVDSSHKIRIIQEIGTEDKPQLMIFCYGCKKFHTLVPVIPHQISDFEVDE